MVSRHPEHSAAVVPPTGVRAPRTAAETVVVALLLTIQTGLLAFSATTHSPTDLEPAFLASGICHWETGRFDLYRVNPPLVRLVAALPSLAAGYQADWSRSTPTATIRAEFGVGSDFVRANGARTIPLLISARWACIAFSLIGSWYAYRWGRALYGAGAGLVTLTLVVFDPNLLAHGELITPDAACAALGVTAGYAFWCWLCDPTWRRAIVAGLTLGLAELTKTSWLILFALWPMLWLFWRLRGPNKTRQAQVPQQDLRPPITASEGPSYHVSLGLSLAQLLGILLVAVALMNLAYLFGGTGTALGEFRFSSTALRGVGAPGSTGNRFQGTALAGLPVPWPAALVEGIDLQKKDFESFSQRSFLNSEWRRGGWWYYYLDGLAMKTPGGTLLLLLVVLGRRLLPGRVRLGLSRDEIVLLAPAASLIALVSSQTGFNIHLRYVLPAIPPLLIFAGQASDLLTFTRLRAILVDSSDWQSNRRVQRWDRLRTGATRLTIGILIAGSVVGPLSCYPHHMTYFNEFIGGPERGFRHLRGSSFDWGQGLLSAAAQMQQDPSLIGYFPAEQCALAESMHFQMRLPSVRDFAGPNPVLIRLPALVSPNILGNPEVMVGTAERESQPITVQIPPDCRVQVDDGFLRLSRDPFSPRHSAPPEPEHRSSQGLGAVRERRPKRGSLIWSSSVTRSSSVPAGD